MREQAPDQWQCMACLAWLDPTCPLAGLDQQMEADEADKKPSALKPYYDEDGVTIYLGDCRNVLPSLGHFDLCLTDPPYGIGYTGWGGAAQPRQAITSDSIRISLALYRDVMQVLDADHLLWFTRWDVWPDVWHILGAAFKLRGLLIWDKGHPGTGDLKHWGPSYELIASAGVGTIKGARDGSIARFLPLAPAKRVHPTEKPLALLSYLIGKLAPRTVIDPFMGSGSTLLAAHRYGCRVVGIETDESYCQAAVERLAQSTLEAA